jgi:hypothetical protein
MVHNCTQLALHLLCFDEQDNPDEYQVVCFLPFHVTASFLCCFLVHKIYISGNLQRKEIK